jgi:hypothetical protein
MINYLTLQSVQLRRFQAEKFIFTIQVNNRRHKIFQVVFGKSDGSLYITFPYFQAQNGFVSIGTIPRFIRHGQINLEPSGKVTSHKVKYAHHPDGEVHFSQAGKVQTSIRRTSLPLHKTEGHLFTIHLQDVSSFDIDPATEDHPAKQNKTTLNFDFEKEFPDSIKFVGRWYSPESFLSKSKISNKSYGPNIRTQTPDGKVRNAFLVGTLQDWPLDQFLLLITCEGLSILDKENKSLLMFLGGFDPPNIMNDLSKPYSFLYMSYPAPTYETLLKRLGSIDIER